MNTQLLKGDCREQLATLPDCSIDSIVTDPPYGLNFMGKEWDRPEPTDIVCVNCGDDLATLGLNECSDCIHKGVAPTKRFTAQPAMLGQISANWNEKATHSRGYADNDNRKFQLWCEEWTRECFRVLKPGGHLIAFGGSRTYHRLACAVEDAGFEIRDQLMWVYGSGFPKSLNLKDTWQGWGTALKPSHEPMVLARKPLSEKTVAENVLRWGTGALNINGTRVASDDGFEKAWDKPVSTNISSTAQAFSVGTNNSHIVDLSQNKPVGGRWPANFIHDGSDEVLELFPESTSKSGGKSGTIFARGASRTDLRVGHDDSGSAARFFYCAKASKSERNAGLDHLPLVKGGSMQSDETRPGKPTNHPERQNFHPTVKPVALMRYLIRLVTPPNGTVLDPFAGSGTTLVAAIHEQFDSIGIELTPDYWPIIEARTDHAKNNPELA